MPVASNLPTCPRSSSAVRTTVLSGEDDRPLRGGQTEDEIVDEIEGINKKKIWHTVNTSPHAPTMWLKRTCFAWGYQHWSRR